MKIDGNENMKRAMRLYREGDHAEYHRLEDAFTEELHTFCETHEHCSCPIVECKNHGNCRDCVAIHRGHREHLPNCFHSMVNEKLNCLGMLTEQPVSVETYVRQLAKDGQK